ncbi:MAG: PilZ domain-containing protein [Polyangiaceae bacterium]|nr:PilZ domain-containing protein [Polyangiaceae bacterium]
MSLRGAETSGKNGPEAERRKSRARVMFEAAVTASDENGSGAFEAESIDVSPEGMRLRSAHVPNIGERLLCRFDGPDGEVAVEGEVAWRNEESKGGEIGIKFTALDAATEEAVRALVKQLETQDEADEKADALPRGARVRLHIDGLASPMKARVRDGSEKETLVGSNLEFLKVGRSLEVEDVDKGARREAFVDHVKVEVDAASGVPQLVVALRYEAIAPPKPSAKAVATSASMKSDAAAASSKAKAAPAKTVEPEIDEDSSLDAEAVSDQPGDVEESDPRGLAKVSANAAQAGRKVVGKVGPALTSIGANAKGAFTKLFDVVRKRREARAEQKKKDAPRRMTAPPPGGALKADGKRLVRDDGEEDESLTPPPSKKNKKAALMGSALGLLAVLVVFGITRFVAMRNAAPAADAAAPSSTVAALNTAAPSDTAAVATLQVPLFGATPASTTESVPTAAPSASAMAANEPEPGLNNDEGSGDDGDDEGGSADGTKEWGEGNVRSPVTIRVKLDGDVEGFNGAKGATGFTIVLPNRRILSTASELQKKDKRIATFQVTNKPGAAELTIQFKDGVPAYLARAKDNKLEILLGSDGKAKKAVAKATKSKSKSDSKKGAKSTKGKKGKK